MNQLSREGHPSWVKQGHDGGPVERTRNDRWEKLMKPSPLFTITRCIIFIAIPWKWTAEWFKTDCGHNLWIEISFFNYKEYSAHMHNFKISVCYKSNFFLFKIYKSVISHFVSSLLCLPCSGDPNATSRGADWILNCQIQFPNKATFGFQIRQNLIFKFEHSHWPGKWYSPLKSTKHTRGQGGDQKKSVKNKIKNYGQDHDGSCGVLPVQSCSMLLLSI